MIATVRGRRRPGAVLIDTESPLDRVGTPWGDCLSLYADEGGQGYAITVQTPRRPAEALLDRAGDLDTAMASFAALVAAWDCMPGPSDGT